MSTSADLEKLLRNTRTVAVVGVSADPARPSHGVYSYLRSHSHYEVYPVNPTVTEIDGEKVYPSLAELPVVPDLVDVFRRHDLLPSVLEEVLALPTLPTTLWLQQGLFHEQVARDARAAGLQVVMDRCLKVDYQLLVT
ncbi:MAG: CoA-binding protein [Mycobacterium sp.]